MEILLDNPFQVNLKRRKRMFNSLKQVNIQEKISSFLRVQVKELAESMIKLKKTNKKMKNICLEERMFTNH